MKKTAFILFALLLSLTYIGAQQKGKPVAKFQSSTHDFGKIAESIGTATCEFSFTNTGDAPIIINRVAASCGCTTPTYTKEPVLPGKDGKITVAYSTKGRVGNIDKTVTVFTNVPDSVYTLRIKGEVLAK